ncbi:MAG: hypothetical protein IT332_02360 [Ardenticatenales bacterium]|nr:hypothetical protein [Ardenticatenales bacterium]
MAKTPQAQETVPDQPVMAPSEPDAMLDVTESPRLDVVTDVMTSVLLEDISMWRKVLAVSETHNSALRLSAQERDDIEDCVLLLRRKFGIKTSMNELARLGLLLLVRDVRTRKSESLVCAVKKL